MNKIKTHLREHKNTYILVGSCAVVAGITWGIMREPRAILRGGMDCPAKEPTGSLSFAKTFFGDATNNVTTTIHTGSKGHPGFVTRCIETGELFATQGDAARTFDIPENFMSAHLNKGFELKEGVSFERVGVLA